MEHTKNVNVVFLCFPPETESDHTHTHTHIKTNYRSNDHVSSFELTNTSNASRTGAALSKNPVEKEAIGEVVKRTFMAPVRRRELSFSGPDDWDRYPSQ